MSENTTQRGSCPCGHAQFEVHVAPDIRFFCHCTICQTLYKRAFADVTILPWQNLQIENEDTIEFKKYRTLAAINRGTCQKCAAPVMAYAGSGKSRLAFIAADNYEQASFLPEPKLHIFYDSRQQPIVDDLPKYKGYIRSQLAVLRLMRQ